MGGDGALESILALEAPPGMLSIHAGLRPEEETGPRPARELELRHELERARVRLNGAVGRVRATAPDRRPAEAEAASGVDETASVFRW